MELVLGCPVRLVVLEDNRASIAIVRKGWSPKLRTLLRNQKCNLQQLHEILTAEPDELNGRGPVELRHHEVKKHKGDLFTKFLVPCKFERGLELLKMRKARLPAPIKKGPVVDFGTPTPREAKATEGYSSGSSANEASIVVGVGRHVRVHPPAAAGKPVRAPPRVAVPEQAWLALLRPALRLCKAGGGSGQPNRDAVGHRLAFPPVL